MLGLKNRHIDLIEVDSHSVRKKYSRLNKISEKKRGLSFNLLRLAISYTRAVLTKEPSSFELLDFSHSNFKSLRQIIYTKASNLCLRNGFREMFKDFTRTGKTGELGQAINYLFAQEILGYPVINDFETYCEKKGINFNSNDRTPDFIIRKTGLRPYISILESKGNCPKTKQSGKAKLREGFEQCDSAVNIFNANGIKNPFKNHYSANVLLSEKRDKWKSRLLYSDPQSEAQDEIDDQLLIKRHYSSFFLISGLADEAFSLSHGSETDITIERFDRIKIGQEENSFVILNGYNSRFNFFWPYYRLFDDFHNFNSAIDERVFNYLRAPNEYEFPEISYSELSSKNFELFADGTVIFNINANTS